MLFIHAEKPCFVMQYWEQMTHVMVQGAYVHLDGFGSIFIRFYIFYYSCIKSVAFSEDCAFFFSPLFSGAGNTMPHSHFFYINLHRGLNYLFRIII